MDKHRVWPVLWLGLFLIGMNGLATAGGGHGRHGGYRGHGNVGVSVVVDPFLFAPGYYPRPYYYPRAYYSPYYYPGAYYSYSPYYYPPAVVTVPTEPPVYIERGAVAEPAPQTSASWYYCADPQGYYPYVERCRGDWQAVAPRPSDAPDEGR